MSSKRKNGNGKRGKVVAFPGKHGLGEPPAAPASKRSNLSCLTFFKLLKWIDGKPLTNYIEPYREALFTELLDSYRKDGSLKYNLCLIGRGKKNWKSADLVLIGLFKLLCGSAPQGNDILLLSNDEDQSNQNLRLAKKLIAVNPELGAELECFRREVRRHDGGGLMQVLPADVPGSHGRTAACVCCGMRSTLTEIGR